MKTEPTAAFHIIGIAVRTTNENQQAATDIGKLWQRFMSEGIAANIPNKISDSIYCIYTDYEKDYTKPYTAILGCAVSGLTDIPEGMTGKTIPAGHYQQFTAEGNIFQGAVADAWVKIWNTDIDRAYTADFEVYDERAQDPENAIVTIFIAVQ